MNAPGPQPPPVSAPHKDRKAGLVVFGALTAAAGAFSLLMIGLILVSLTLVRNRPDLPSPGAPLITVAVYAVVGLTLICLGIGSIMAKRWARALLAVLSWCALATGVYSAGFLYAIRSGFVEVMRTMRPPNQPELPPGTEAALFAMMAVIMLIFYIILPLVWGLFYSSKNVKATCEQRDPKMRWTDRCPLPLLAVVLWAAFGAGSMIVLGLWRPIAPAFGLLLTGPVAGIILLLTALLWGYSAWLLYRLNLIGWWVLLLTFALFSVSSLMTYSHVSVEELYRHLNYPPQQIALMSKLVPQHLFKWISVICTVPFLAYLLYVRRFFPTRIRSSAG